MTVCLLEKCLGPVFVVTINRPQVRNAIDRATSEAIAKAMDRFDEDPELRVGVLTGGPSVFSSGMDLRAFSAGELPFVAGRGFAGFVESRPRKPLIAAVEGAALAGGFEIVLACDLVVASRGAVFGIPEVRRGLIAAGGGLARLPRRMPLNIAMELALTGAAIDGERAAQLGLVNRVVAEGDAVKEAIDLAEEIAGNGPLATLASKGILGMATEKLDEDVWLAQAAINDEIQKSNDAREGAAAFVEKRAPSWTSS